MKLSYSKLFFSLFFLLFLFKINGICQETGQSDNGFIDSLMKSKAAYFSKVLNNPAKYRVQIIYTQVNRDSNNVPHLSTYYYRHLPDEYFYPASSVKMPLSVFALEKLNGIGNPWITKNTKIRFFKSWKCQTATESDKFTSKGYNTIGNYISKALVVSDNSSYNRLYEFCGQKYIQKRLAATVSRKARIIHRFSLCSDKENRHTNAFEFLVENSDPVYFKSQVKHWKYRKPIKNMKVGKAYFDNNGKLIHRPKDFSNRNYMPLSCLHEVLEKIVFPANFPKKEQFKLNPEDYRFLLRQLSYWPDETNIPALKDTSVYYRTMTNYLFYGNNKNAVIDSNIMIFNIVGQAYGFLTDCAYIVDFSKNTEFFLSAVIYVNNDGILNDDIYEYQSIGFPFFKNLGLLFYDYENKRQHSFQPELSDFRNFLFGYQK